MYKILLLITTIFLFIQCNPAGIRLPGGSNQQGHTDPDGSERIPQNDIPVENVQLGLQENYPYFMINSSTGTSLPPLNNIQPPIEETMHADTSLDAFRVLLKKDKNMLLSPFIYTAGNNGATTIEQLAEATRNKLRIKFNQHTIKSHEVVRALAVSGNWSQDTSPEKTQVDFQTQKISGMHISGKCYFYENAQMKLIFLPLDIDFNVYLFIPKEENLGKFIENMKFTQINDAIQRLKKVNCEIDLPSFRIYLNLATEVNERLISFLQIDHYGCEFAAALVKWKEIPRGNILSLTENFSDGGETAKIHVRSTEDELDLATIKAPYLKNVSEESINAVIDKPFFLLLRHSTTGEFLTMAAIKQLQPDLEKQSIVQHLDKEEGERKRATVEKFGWSYTRKSNMDFLEEQTPAKNN